MELEARKRNTIDLQRTKGDVLKMAVRIPSPELLKTVCKCQDCHLYETANHPYIPINQEQFSTYQPGMVIGGKYVSFCLSHKESD